MDKVVHFEIPTDDLDRAKGFYGSIFGWQLQTMEQMDYTTAMTTPVDEQTQMPTEPGGINGGMMKRSADAVSPVLTIGVDSVEESLNKVEAEGGSVVRPRTEVPGMGAFGYFKDTEGNVLGLWESA
ncbi:MAG: VOC family protein [Actinomycetota bacterium]|nr:VOC family protein [Actinomycetota bacterium]MDH5223805.1 VOC family protein [Actinomycetota bacterium]MDH5313102.1 VOC family protein [Actinomycetota bacterium]